MGGETKPTPPKRDEDVNVCTLATTEHLFFVKCTNGDGFFVSPPARPRGTRRRRRTRMVTREEKGNEMGTGLFPSKHGKEQAGKVDSSERHRKYHAVTCWAVLAKRLAYLRNTSSERIRWCRSSPRPFVPTKSTYRSKREAHCFMVVP